MSAPACLVTGSSGLVGSEVCAYLSERGAVVHGIDNNERAMGFGPPGDTAWSRERRAKSHDVAWSVSTSLRDAIREIVSTWNERMSVR